MFDNWWKDFDPLNYETVKKNIQKFNEKSMSFWKDFTNDIFKYIKKND